ncbi:hypothetical protein [Aquimarina sp. MMG016]|uniref:hypothetical protein n=1 Tax=Aquimarina sp. MMG016 TaxID=2822690 RepID=UPI001B3A65E2|nr:hypothetical protein [Aquimarina sp. MMG016]MBQ4821256.1 hypothetical protein [Aquimarina sp. MMG016]
MNKHYDLGFAKVEIHDDYLINTISEGFVVMPEHNKILLDFVEEHFGDKHFIYISHRINSYSVNPTVYHETTKIKNLIGMAIVSKNQKQKSLCEIESSFYGKDLKHFTLIEDALTWKDFLLSRHKKKEE